MAFVRGAAREIECFEIQVGSPGRSGREDRFTDVRLAGSILPNGFADGYRRPDSPAALGAPVGRRRRDLLIERFPGPPRTRLPCLGGSAFRTLQGHKIYLKTKEIKQLPFSAKPARNSQTKLSSRCRICKWIGFFLTSLGRFSCEGASEMRREFCDQTRPVLNTVTFSTKPGRLFSQTRPFVSFARDSRTSSTTHHPPKNEESPTP